MRDLWTEDGGRPSVLVVAAKWWPLSARLAMGFLRRGWRVAAASHRGHPLRYVSGIARHHRYGGVSSLASLRRALERERPTLVVACDDGVVWQLHLLHQRCPELRELLERSLGPPENFAMLRSRGQLPALACRLGIRTPATRLVTAGEDLSWVAAARPAVLKVDGSCGGNGVDIARTPREARGALLRMTAGVGLSRAWKQLLIDRDPLPMAEYRERLVPGVTLQQYVAGRPANAMLACWEGRLLGMVTVEVVTSHGATGAATVVRRFEHPAIRRAAELLTGRLGLTGFHGLDFLLEEGTGEPLLIELNPRPTQLGHLPVTAEGDLIGMLCTAASGAGPGSPVEVIGREMIAFFPQAMRLNPGSAHLAAAHHDVPEEEPGLYRELLREPWPDRRLLARIYLWLRPRRRHAEVEFFGDLAG